MAKTNQSKKTSLNSSKNKSTKTTRKSIKVSKLQ